MTAIILVRAEDSVIIYSDGAAYDHDQVMGQVHAKVDCLPHLPAIIGRRGSAGIDLALSIAVRGKYETFDQMVAGIEEDIPEMAEIQFYHAGVVNMGLYIGGFSAERDRWETYWIAANGPYPDELTEHSLKLEPAGWLVAQPDLTEEQWSDILPVGENLSVTDEHFIAMMEAQRRNKYPSGATADSTEAHVVGAFIQRTILSHRGIDTQIIKRWPDPVGERINPFREIADAPDETA